MIRVGTKWAVTKGVEKWGITVGDVVGCHSGLDFLHRIDKTSHHITHWEHGPQSRWSGPILAATTLDW